VEHAGSVRFGRCPSTYVHTPSGVEVSRGHSLKLQKLGGLEVVDPEHLCVLSDGKDQVGKRRLVGLRDKSRAAFDGLLATCLVNAAASTGQVGQCPVIRLTRSYPVARSKADGRITATWQRQFCPLPKDTDGI
jgi:hypothetical protein